MRSSRSRATAGTAALIGTLLLAGCAAGGDATQSTSGSASPSSGSTPATGPSASSPPSPLLSPEASPVLDAVTATRALGSATVHVRNAASVGRQDVWVSIGDGSLDLAKGLGRIAFTSSHGGTSELLVNQDGAFVSPDGGAQWFLLGFGQTTPLMGAINVFRGLDRVDWGAGEADTVGGRVLTRYDGVMVDATIADAMDGMGVSTEQPELLAQVGSLEIDVSVWVDDAGRIVRVLRSIDGTTPEGPLQATQLVTLSRFREAIDLASPPEDRVQPAPEG